MYGQATKLSIIIILSGEGTCIARKSKAKQQGKTLVTKKNVHKWILS